MDIRNPSSRLYNEDLAPARDRHWGSARRHRGCAPESRRWRIVPADEETHPCRRR